MSQQPPEHPPEGWQPPEQQPTEPQAQRWETYGPPAPPGQDHSAWAAQRAREERREKPPGEPRRPPRVFMWVILVINGVFLWWLISAVAGIAEESASGAGIVFILILLLWALVDVILAVIFLVTRRRD
jgi:hypothetical protein